MSDPTSRPLEPSELLRVMDAAQMIRARQERVEESAFDRDATVREIQVMYEDLGDLVDRDVIERALDQYQAKRYAFTPPRTGPLTALAWVYVRRSMLARRLLAPIVVLAGMGWAASAFSAHAERQSLVRDTESLRSAVTEMLVAHDEDTRALESLQGSPTVEALPAGEAAQLADRARAVDDLLLSAGVALAEVSGSDAMSGPASRQSVEELRGRVAIVRPRLEEAEADLAAIEAILRRQERLGALVAEVSTLEASIREAAEEPGLVEEETKVVAMARRQAGLRDVTALEASVAGLRQTLATLDQEYRIQIVGGVWRYKDDDPDVRNYYLRVRAVTADGEVVARPVLNEETGRVEVVREWGERVPKEVYDRVGSDKEDNGIIDEDGFGTKRRGWVSIERRHPDIGQITSWSDA